MSDDDKEIFVEKKNLDSLLHGMGAEAVDREHAEGLLGSFMEDRSKRRRCNRK